MYLKLDKLLDKVMLRLFLSIIFLSPPALANTQYFCFQADGNKNILLLGSNYSQNAKLMYFPYLMRLQLKYKNYEAIKMAEGRPDEFHDYFDEIVKGKVIGQYEIIHQGAIFYGINYTNRKTRKVTEFTRINGADHPQTAQLLHKQIEYIEIF